MPETWTGHLIGEMHNSRVTLDELAQEVGWGKPYISMILNGHRSPTNGREKLEAALAAIIDRKRGTNHG